MSQVRRKRKGQEQESFVGFVGFTAGALFGIHELIWIAIAGKLETGPVSFVLLALVTIGTPGLIGWLVGVIFSWFKQRRQVAFCVAASMVGLVFFGEWWFTDPPPFAPRAPLQGNLPVFVVVASALLVGSALAATRLRKGVITGVVLLILLVDSGWMVSWHGQHQNTVGSPQGPNVLLITLDTARADRFARGRQVHFDRVANQGVRFQTAVAPIPVTGPSHMSMMTGAPRLGARRAP